LVEVRGGDEVSILLVHQTRASEQQRGRITTKMMRPAKALFAGYELGVS